jgi:hypothetical protein
MQYTVKSAHSIKRKVRTLKYVNSQNSSFVISQEAIIPLKNDLTYLKTTRRR